MRVTYEVVLFDGINDTPRELRRLIAFARMVPCKVNIIPYHSIAFAGPEGLAASLRPSPRMQECVAELRRANLTVMVRSSAGEDIAAACGQLAVQDARRKRIRGGTNAHSSFWSTGSGEGNAGETSR
jgi:23S rRNA (adenine2503-C2)-methyltransferase